MTFRAVRVITIVLTALSAASQAAAQATPASEFASMSIEDLLKVEVVSAASKFPQDVREAPASVTVVTAADIRRQGHRTLADVLRGVRGFYTTYDRNYTYVGIRGFARPGDYNTRVLLLVDGHRMNDPIYDMAPIGTDFPIDVSLIDKVEIVRGSASSLYGTNAVFAVINVVTRTGAQHTGMRAAANVGSLGTRGATASFGGLFGDNGELLLAVTREEADGQRRFEVPAFDTPDARAVAIDLDGDEATRIFGAVSRGRLSVHGAVARRDKTVPTGAYGSIFGESLTTSDTRAYVGGSYEGPFGRGWSGIARVAFHSYQYEGIYPVDLGEPEPIASVDGTRSHAAIGEITATRRLGRKHVLTAGAELTRQFTADLYAYGDPSNVVDERRPGTGIGLYVQDELRVTPWLVVNAGLRLDRRPRFDPHLAPRAAVVLLPRATTSVKAVHSRAFRAPNPYELYFYALMRDGSVPLAPERMQSTEVVWEERLSARVRTTVTAYLYEMDSVIEVKTRPAADESGLDGYFFANAGLIRGKGLEAEVEARHGSGASLTAGIGYASTRDVLANGRLSNSPAFVSGAAVHLPLAGFHLGVESQYVGSRITLAGERLKSAFLPNITLSSPERKRLELAVSVYNASNTAYAVPGGEEHLQQSIRQDGRTVLARLRVRF
jgi:iron complex outermembrane receptor protein